MYVLLVLLRINHVVLDQVLCVYLHQLLLLAVVRDTHFSVFTALRPRLPVFLSTFRGRELFSLILEAIVADLKEVFD